jgi:hypothetical protein
MPLTYHDKGNSHTVMQIMFGNGCARHVVEVLSVSSGEVVHWSWSWHAGPAARPQQHGTAENVDAAKAEIEEQWRTWLESAGLHERS